MCLFFGAESSAIELRRAASEMRLASFRWPPSRASERRAARRCSAKALRPVLPLPPRRTRRFGGESRAEQRELCSPLLASAASASSRRDFCDGPQQQQQQRQLQQRRKQQRPRPKRAAAAKRGVASALLIALLLLCDSLTVSRSSLPSRRRSDALESSGGGGGVGGSGSGSKHSEGRAVGAWSAVSSGLAGRSRSSSRGFGSLYGVLCDLC